MRPPRPIPTPTAQVAPSAHVRRGAVPADTLFRGLTRRLGRLLLAAGADPNSKDRYGNTPLHWAAANAPTTALPLLLAGGGDPYQINNNTGWTPLHVAALFDKGDALQLLLARGGDPNLADKTGYTPLHRAVKEGYIRVVELLLAGGADPNSKNNQSETPLHRAVKEGYIRVVELLLQHGADVHIKDVFGRAALDVPRTRGSQEIRALLQAAAGVLSSSSPTRHGSTKL